MEQGPSWESDSRLAGKETFHLVETEGSLSCLQEPAIGLCPKPDI
jgi:hypothetical protein